MSRSELENFIITKEQELDNLRSAIANGENVPFSKLVKIEDEIEDAESELEQLAELERDDNSGSNLENARTREKIKEYEIDEQDVLEANRIKEEQEKDLEEVQTQEEQEQQENEEALTEELENTDDSSPKFTLAQWENRTGINIVPDDYIRQKYSKDLTEEQFKEILKNENVPKIIQEPGLAENYLKTPEDWASVKTSKSAIDQAIRSGNFPTEVNEESYILLEYNKDKIMDEHEDRNEDGYGKIDEEDIYGKASKGSGAEKEIKDSNGSGFEEEIKDSAETKDDDIKANENAQESIIEQIAKNYLKIKGVEANIAMASQIVGMAKSMGYMDMSTIDIEQLAPLIDSNLDSLSDDTAKSDFDKISRNMVHDLEHPELEEEHEINEEEQMPGIPRKIQY